MTNYAVIFEGTTSRIEATETAANATLEKPKDLSALRNNPGQGVTVKGNTKAPIFDSFADAKFLLLGHLKKVRNAYRDRVNEVRDQKASDAQPAKPKTKKRQVQA